MLCVSDRFHLGMIPRESGRVLKVIDDPKALLERTEKHGEEVTYAIETGWNADLFGAALRRNITPTAVRPALTTADRMLYGMVITSTTIVWWLI